MSKTLSENIRGSIYNGLDFRGIVKDAFREKSFTKRAFGGASTARPTTSPTFLVDREKKFFNIRWVQGNTALFKRIIFKKKLFYNFNILNSHFNKKNNFRVNC